MASKRSGGGDAMEEDDFVVVNDSMPEEATGESPSMGVKIKANSFQTMGLEKEIIYALNRMNYKAPTPVQRKALPVVLSGLDVVCMARTGSGKTCVFVLPLVQRLKSHQPVGCRALILSPTRELALQTSKVVKDMARFTDLRIVEIFGGDSIDAQFDALSSKPDVIVATPGRLMHHLREVNTFKLRSVRYLVFDEADRLFEMGFADQLNEIVRECPKERQTLLFSATLPKQLVQFSRAGLKDPQLIRLDTDIKMSDELRMAFFHVRSNEKLAALTYLVRNIIPKGQQTIVFTATKHHSELVHALMERIGASSTLIYGTMDQDARTFNLRRFRNGEVEYLIVTDVAARGIDVPLLNNVINFHFPPAPKLFVHRCGRAARQGRVGYAFSLVDSEELSFAMDVHRFLNKKIDTGYGIPPEVEEKLEALRKKLRRAQASAGDNDSELSSDEDLDENDEQKNNEEEEMPWLQQSGLTEESLLEMELPKYGLRDCYTFEQFTPAMIHSGLLPQDAIDEENDFVKSALEADDTLETLHRIAENGMKQYKRTRTEATHEGVKAAKKVIKSEMLHRIHPLLVGVDPRRCNSSIVEKAAFIRKLQTFRPSQTVFETGIGTGSYFTAGSGSANEKQQKATEVMKALRKTTENALERNKKLTPRVDLNTLLTKATAEHDDNIPEPNKPDMATFSDSEDEDDDDEYDVDDSMSIGSNTIRTMQKKRLSAADKKRLKKMGADAFNQWKVQQENLAASNEVAENSADKFKDKFFMGYGNEDANSYAEETLQPLSNLRSSETFAANQMDRAITDIDPDEAMDNERKRKIMRWDPKKRKFVKQTLAEMAAASKSGLKRMRSESGVALKSSSKAQGEMYAEWKKKRRREINDEDEDDTDYRKRPNFKINSGVADEVRRPEQVRKLVAKREDLKLKNMEKSQRRRIETKMRQEKNIANAGKGAGYGRAGMREPPSSRSQRDGGGRGGGRGGGSGGRGGGGGGRGGGSGGRGGGGGRGRGGRR